MFPSTCGLVSVEKWLNNAPLCDCSGKLLIFRASARPTHAHSRQRLAVEDVVLHLEGKLIRIAVGSSAPVRQPLDPTFLVAVEDFVAGLAGDSELPAKLGHPLAS